jgi:hypothetical protein
MRNALLLLLGLSCLSAFGSTDVAITALTADKTTAQTGEDVRLTIRVRNHGADTALGVNLNVGSTFGTPLHSLGSSAPNGWRCSTSFANCYASELPAGSDAEIALHVALPPRVSHLGFAIDARVTAMNESPFDTDNNGAGVSIQLQPSSRVADLSVSLTAPPNPVPESTAMTLAADVRNIGPHHLSDVRALIYVSLSGKPLTFGGDGWTCVPDQEGLTATCRRQSLVSGERAPLDVHYTTPDRSAMVDTRVRVFAAQPHLDPEPFNEDVSHLIFVGDAANWSRVLLPITTTDIPGANGSVWKTEIAGFIDPMSGVTIEPEGCGPIEDPCSLPPQGRSFDVRGEDLVVDESGSQFIYLSRAAASGFQVSTRVYDASKSDETSGAFLPTARDDDFSENGFTLVGIPVSEQFRARLRIYDYDGRNAARVEVGLYGDEETDPFYSGAHVLFSEPGLFTFTTALLPSHPASTQIDLSALIPAGYSRVRVAVRPLDEPLKLWGFVTVTNNATSHVTIIAP